MSVAARAPNRSAALPPIPVIDLAREHEQIGDELREAFDAVLADSGFVLGDEVERFEGEFAAMCEVPHCVGVGSGTAGLTLALIAAGVGTGDEVIVPAHTYIATALAVLHAGAVPRFCDVDDDTGLVDLESAASVVSDRTAAIIAVHLYGQVCDMEALALLARRNGLLLIEDAAQAHGARWRMDRAGSLGDVAAFSFYPSKNLGALGDGGAVCTNSDEIAERCRRLRNLGQRSKGDHTEAGFNERLDGMQAAWLRVKLARLERSNEARRGRASLYREVLPDDCRTLAEDPRAECVYHLFPIRVNDRDRVREHLLQSGVATGIHYSPALHRQPLFADLGLANGELPNAAAWSREEVSLPMFAELTDDEVQRVGEAVGLALAEEGR